MIVTTQPTTAQESIMQGFRQLKLGTKARFLVVLHRTHDNFITKPDDSHDVLQVTRNAA